MYQNFEIWFQNQSLYLSRVIHIRTQPKAISATAMSTTRDQAWFKQIFKHQNYTVAQMVQVVAKTQSEISQCSSKLQ